MKLFHERSYAEVGVAELAHEMGVQPPSLYSAFGSKLGVLRKALALYREETTFLSNALGQDGPAADAVAAVFIAAAETYAARGTGRGCLVMSGTENCGDEGACELTGAMIDETRDAIMQRLRSEFPDTAATVADYTVTVLRGLSAAARDGTSTERLRSIATVAAEGARVALEGPSPPTHE